jgi:hypothetical protein
MKRREICNNNKSTVVNKLILLWTSTFRNITCLQ